MANIIAENLLETDSQCQSVGKPLEHIKALIS